MTVRFGIIGTPNSGKSTLFSVLTGSNAEINPYPFSTVEPNCADIFYCDSRLEKIINLFQSQHVGYERLSFIDLPALTENSSLGEGLGNQFLWHAHDVDIFLCVIPAFDEDDNSSFLPHELIHRELIKFDLDRVARYMRQKSNMLEPKNHGAILQRENAVLREVYSQLERYQIGAISNKEFLIDFSEKRMPLLSLKPRLHILNVDKKREMEFADTNLDCVQKFGLSALERIDAASMLSMVSDCEKILPKNRKNFETWFQVFMGRCYEQANFVRFFTLKNNAIRAWSARKGSDLRSALMLVHEDCAQGIFSADILSPLDIENMPVNFDVTTLLHAHYRHDADYEVRDGDLIMPHFGD